MPLTFDTRVMSIPEKILQPTAPKSPNSTGLKLTTLPSELLLQIFQTLPLFDRAALALTCKSLARISTSFSLLTFSFHLPVAMFPPPASLTTYEHDLTLFLLRLSQDWANSKLKFCQSCGKFLPTDKQYWDDKALANMVRSCGRNGGKWRRACQHFGGTYQFMSWVERWCKEPQVLKGDQGMGIREMGGDPRVSCPGCRVLASSG